MATKRMPAPPLTLSWQTFVLVAVFLAVVLAAALLLVTQ
jgi:hypothetical protein